MSILFTQATGINHNRGLKNHKSLFLSNGNSEAITFLVKNIIRQLVEFDCWCQSAKCIYNDYYFVFFSAWDHNENGNKNRTKKATAGGKRKDLPPLHPTARPSRHIIHIFYWVVLQSSAYRKKCRVERIQQ